VEPEHPPPVAVPPLFVPPVGLLVPPVVPGAVPPVAVPPVLPGAVPPVVPGAVPPLFLPPVLPGAVPPVVGFDVPPLEGLLVPPVGLLVPPVGLLLPPVGLLEPPLEGLLLPPLEGLPEPPLDGLLEPPELVVPPPLVEPPPPLVAAPPVPCPPEAWWLLSGSGGAALLEQPMAAAAATSARVPTNVLKERRGSMVILLPRMLKLINPEEALRAVRLCWSSPELALYGRLRLNALEANEFYTTSRPPGRPGEGAKNAARSAAFRTAVPNARRTEDKRAFGRNLQAHCSRVGHPLDHRRLAAAGRPCGFWLPRFACIFRDPTGGGNAFHDACS
jgi:hypothetical protein